MEILMRTAYGRQYCKLYYEHTGELILIFFSHPGLLQMTKDILLRLFPYIISVLKAGEDIEIARTEIVEVLKLLDKIATFASPQLRLTLYKLRQDIVTGKFLKIIKVSPREIRTYKLQ